MSDPIFFSDIEKIASIVVASTAMYVLTVALIRVSGKRSTSQMNNFDWVVTVSIGSIMSSGALLSSVTVSQAATAITVLLGLQWLVTKLSVHSRRFSNFIRAEPSILVENGQYCHSTMKRVRVTEAEIQAAIRQAGSPALDEVRWVIMESNAGMTVLRRNQVADETVSVLGPDLPRSGA